MMIYEDFLRKAKLTEKDVPRWQYKRMERVGEAYNRFDTDEDFLSFYSSYGKNGIDVLYEPFERLDSMGNESKEAQLQIEKLLAQIEEAQLQIEKLRKKKASIVKQQMAVAMQCDMNPMYIKLY